MTKPQPYSLVLRTCNEDLTSKNNFKYPSKGKVTCPDWNQTPTCGGGLHGFLWGCGKGSLANWNDNAKWLVIKVLNKNLVNIDNQKCKFKTGFVVFCGSRKDATDYLLQHPSALDKPVIGCYKIGGEKSILTGGKCSTLTGGNWSTLTGGDKSTLTGGFKSTLSGGDDSTLTGGDYSTLTGGFKSTLNGGNRSTLTGGDDSTLTGGDYSTLTGGFKSTLNGGNRSTLTGCNNSTLTGGNNSTLTWKIWDGKHYRLYTAYVGENDIKPNKPYICENGIIKLKT
jgi:hypothetical protein